MEGSRGLVAVDEPELGDAKRKLAPQRTQAAHQLHVPGTAHRLQRPGLALDDQHPLAEDAPVTAALPDWLGEDLGTPHLAVALTEDDAPEVVLEGAEELEPAWMPEHAPGGLLLEVEQPQAVAEGAVIIVVQHWSDSGDEARRGFWRDDGGPRARAPRRDHGRDGDGRAREVQATDAHTTLRPASRVVVVVVASPRILTLGTDSGSEPPPSTRPRAGGECDGRAAPTE